MIIYPICQGQCQAIVLSDCKKEHWCFFGGGVVAESTHAVPPNVNFELAEQEGTLIGLRNRKQWESCDKHLHLHSRINHCVSSLFDCLSGYSSSFKSFVSFDDTHMIERFD